MKFMEAGEFRHRVSILEFAETSPGAYEWKAAKDAWAKAEHQSARGIFSSNTIMQRTVKFTLRADPGITLHNALRFGPSPGSHCFLTDINRDIPGFCVITAALIEPVRCEAKRTVTGMGALNRPDVTEVEALSFPGCLAEKYLRQTQLEPMSYSEARYVLVTPKAIELDVGELVTAGGLVCEVAVPHVLDPYKNEFEVLRRCDN